MLRLRQEMIQIKLIAGPFEGSVPGRSARGRYAAEAMELCDMVPSIIVGCELLKL